PSVGWAAGVERLALLVEAAGLTPPPPRPVAVIPLGDAAEGPALDLLQMLRPSGVIAEIAYRGNAKRRMERANKIGAGAAVILGEDELAEGLAIVRNLDAGTQERVPLDDVVRALAETGVVDSAVEALLADMLEAEEDADEAPTP
ncbi:MAG: histidine--tRNA ligase, partial [Variovorax sp.]